MMDTNKYIFRCSLYQVWCDPNDWKNPSLRFRDFLQKNTVLDSRALQFLSIFTLISSIFSDAPSDFYFFLIVFLPFKTYHPCSVIIIRPLGNYSSCYD